MTDKPKSANHTIALDWSRLLGFDQIREAARGEMSLLDSRFAKLGSKACTIAKT